MEAGTQVEKLASNNNKNAFFPPKQEKDERWMQISLQIWGQNLEYTK